MRIIKLTLLAIALISFFYPITKAEAACAGYNAAFSSCLGRMGSDPTANTLCMIEAGNQCNDVEGEERPRAAPPVRNTVTVPDFSDPLSNDFIPWNGPSQSTDVPEPAPAPGLQIEGPAVIEPPVLVPPTNSTPVVRPRPVPATQRTYTPIVITCQHEGTSFFPGQKRYECSSPKERGVCQSDAGYGVPYICNYSGTWDAGNNGLAECANECAVENFSAYVESTCVYSEKRDNGQGYACYAGTGGYGFNPIGEDGQPGCKYSYGPVDCPELPEEQANPDAFNPPPPVESAPGQSCGYQEWSDENPYDCSNGYACYNDWYLNEETSCQPASRDPHYHCEPNDQCGSAEVTTVEEPSREEPPTAQGCEPQNWRDEQPYSCQDGYACNNRWKIAGGESCDPEADYGNDGSWYVCLPDDSCQ